MMSESFMTFYVIYIL